MHAVDAFETALSIYIDDRRDIPKPSAIKRHGKFVTVPALTEAKLALYSAMRAQRVGKAELARRLNWHLPQVDRLLDLLHSSRPDQLEAAFHALGSVSASLWKKRRDHARRCPHTRSFGERSRDSSDLGDPRHFSESSPQSHA